MPEYQNKVGGVDGFNRYRDDAISPMSGPKGPGVREVTRSGDGAVLRMDSTGRVGFLQDGKITNFFRPGGILDGANKFMDNKIMR